MNNQAELISIGNELLCGQTLNTHAKDLGAALAAIGLQLVRDTTIPDDLHVIGSTVQAALDRTPLVFVSGGLGPTIDDITRDALAKVLRCSIILDVPTVSVMAERYVARGRTMSPAAERQALVLEDAAVLPNSVGAAPGQRIDLPGSKTLFALPGPPAEFNAILNEEIIPWLERRHADAAPREIRTVITTGIGESDIVTLLENGGFQPKGVDLGFYPGKGRVRIRISADSGNLTQVQATEKILRGLLSDYLDPDS